MANLKEERKLMNAISEALKYRKNHPNADNSEVTKSVLKLIQAERAEKTKLRIVASVSKILDIAEKNPKLTDKQIIQEFIKEGFPKVQEMKD